MDEDILAMTKTACKKRPQDGSQTDSSTVPDAAELEALSRVREILFGETAREHTDQLQEVQDHLDREVDHLRAEYEAQVASLRAEMKRELDSLRWQLDDLKGDKVARGDLSALLTDMADQLVKVG